MIPTIANEQRYKIYRNKLTATIRLAKKIYYADKLDHTKNDLKGIWREINGIFGKQKKTSLPSEFMDGDIILCPGRMKLQTLSTTSLLTLALPWLTISPHTHYTESLHNPNASSFFLIPTNKEEIIKVGSELKSGNSCGFDGVCSTVVKFVLPFIAEPLSYIFNLSFLTASVPLNLKVAKIIPIFKNGKSRNSATTGLFPSFLVFLKS